MSVAAGGATAGWRPALPSSRRRRRVLAGLVGCFVILVLPLAYVWRWELGRERFHLVRLVGVASTPVAERLPPPATEAEGQEGGASLHHHDIAYLSKVGPGVVSRREYIERLATQRIGWVPNKPIFTHVQVIGGRVYAGNATRETVMDQFDRLEAVLRWIVSAVGDDADFPALDLVLNHYDGCQCGEGADNGEVQLVWTFCRSRGCAASYLLPDYELSAPVFGFDASRAHFLALDRAYPFELKAAQAVWRGGTTGHITLAGLDSSPRVRLASLSLTQSELLDAKFVGHASDTDDDDAVQRELERRRLVGRRLSFSDFAQWWYAVDVDGHFWSSRLPKLLAGNSLVLKVESAWEVFFSDALRRSEAVVDVKTVEDVPGIVDRLNQLSVDARVQRVRRQQQFAAQHLSDAAIVRYMRAMLRAYAAHQQFEPPREPSPGMKHVKF